MIEKIKNKNFISTIFIYIIFKFILDLTYIYWVNPVFGYAGFELNYNLNSIIFSYILLMILVFSIPKSDRKVSSMILNLHLAIIYIPMLVIYGLGGGSFKFTILICVSFLIQTLLINILPSVKFKRFSPKIFGFNIIYIIVLLLTCITYGYLLSTQSLNINSINFNNIYSIRENLKLGTGIITYLISWQYRIVNPLIIIYAFIKDNKILSILGIVLQVLIYLILPQKEIMLSLGLIFLTLFFSKARISFTTYFISFVNLINFISIYLLSRFDIRMPFALITRLLFEPAKIKYQYFDYFSVFDKLYFSEGLIGKIFNLRYRYSEPIGFIIFNYFEPIGRSNSNTGYIAYAYANLGFLGMIIMSLLFVITLKLFDSLSISRNNCLVFSALIYPMLILNDGDLLTLMLTGGLFLLIFILMFNVGDEN